MGWGSGRPAEGEWADKGPFLLARLITCIWLIFGLSVEGRRAGRQIIQIVIAIVMSVLRGIIRRCVGHLGHLFCVLN